jgi:hypothetical protein
MWRIIGSSTPQDYGKWEGKVPGVSSECAFARVEPTAIARSSQELGISNCGYRDSWTRPPLSSARAENKDGTQNFCASSPEV